MAAASAGASPMAVEVNKTNTKAGQYSETIVNSNLNFSGNISINSGKDITVKASSINSGVQSENGGDISLKAGEITTANFNDNSNKINMGEGSVNIISAAQNSYSYSQSQTISLGGSNIRYDNDGLVYGEFRNETDKKYVTVQNASLINANNGDVKIDATKDINITSSNVSAIGAVDTGKIELTSQNGNVNIASGLNTEETIHKTTSGEAFINFEINSNQISLQGGVQGQIAKNKQENGNIVSSNLVANSILIDSGGGLENANQKIDQGNININSSNLVSQNGDVVLNAANNVNLTTSNNYVKSTSQETNFEVDARAEITYNFTDVWKSIEKLKDVQPTEVANAVYGSDGLVANIIKGNDFDETMQGNEKGVNDLSTLFNAGKGASGGAGIYVHLEFDTQKQSQSQESVMQNNILSQNDVRVNAGNSWTDSQSQQAKNNDEKLPEINIASTIIRANNDVELNASKGNLNIIADTNNQEQKQSSFSVNLNIPIMAAGNIGGGFAVSRSESSSETYVNSEIRAGNNFTSNSKNDTNIISSNIIAQNIDMMVGGDLNIESKQNTSKSDASSFAIQGSRGSTSGANSGSISFSDLDANRVWVDNQASIVATNSVNINVEQNTDIKGAMIANISNYINEDGTINKDKELLTDGGNLVLNTDSLSYSDINDEDKMRNVGLGISGSNRSQGGQNRGNASVNFNYAMHDKEQITKATIGQGVINVGGDADSGDLLINRDVNKSQEIIKSVEVAPINVAYTQEWGMSDDVKNNGDEKNFAEKYREQIDPFAAVHKVSDGITTDTRNIATELGVEPVVLNMGEKNKYRTLELKDKEQIDILNYAVANKQKITLESDQDGVRYFNIIQQDVDGKDASVKVYFNLPDALTVQDIANNHNLLANKMSSNGIMNNIQEASRNGVMQVGGFLDNDGRISISYDPTAYPEEKLGIQPGFFEKASGFMGDTLEVGVNFLGAGIFITQGQAQDQKVVEIKTNQIKMNNELTGANDVFTISGHSAGGRRNYITLLNSDPNQYIDANGNSVLQVQSYGAPVNTLDLKRAAERSGAQIVDLQNNSGDFVGNVLGGNGGVVEGVSSAAQSVMLFTKYSPHSNYYCQGSQCNYSSTVDNIQLIEVPRFSIDSPITNFNLQ